MRGEGCEKAEGNEFAGNHLTEKISVSQVKKKPSKRIAKINNARIRPIIRTTTYSECSVKALPLSSSSLWRMIL